MLLFFSDLVFIAYVKCELMKKTGTGLTRAQEKLIKRFTVVKEDDVEERKVDVKFLKELGVEEDVAPKLLQDIMGFVGVKDPEIFTVDLLVGMSDNVQHRCASLGQALLQARVPDAAITRTLSFIEAYHLCKFSLCCFLLEAFE